MRAFWHSVVLSLGLMVGWATPILAQSDTALSYQGELSDAGSPASGAYNLRFTLRDAPAGGSQVGSTVAVNAAQVTDGLFTVELDFGANAFDNSSRWLEISVDGVTVTPRQPITRSPYSIQTRGIFVDQDKKIGVGTTNPDSQLHIDGTNSSEVGLHVEAPGAATGSVRVSSPFGHTGISGNANNGNRRDIYFMDGGLGLFTRASTSSPFPGNGVFIDDFGNVGIGTTTPNYRLHVLRGGGYAIYGETEAAGIGVYGRASGSSFATKGVLGDSTSPSGTGVEGEAMSLTGKTKGVWGISRSNEGRGVSGLASSSSGVNYGVHGECRSSSGFDFFAAGAGVNYGAISSRRWKHNVTQLASSLDVITQLRGVSFDWDDAHGGQRDIGLIAEEVGRHVPEIVQYEENGVDAIGLDYSKLTPLIVEAIKTLKSEKDAEIESLASEHAAELEVLRAEIEALRARFESHEQASMAYGAAKSKEIP